MSGKKRKSRLTGALMALLGAACALLRERGYEDMDYDLLAQLEEENK